MTRHMFWCILGSVLREMIENDFIGKFNVRGQKCIEIHDYDCSV